MRENKLKIVVDGYAICAKLQYMPDLRINNISPDLLAKAKIVAVKEGKTLRQLVIDAVAVAVTQKRTPKVVPQVPDKS